MEKTWPVSKKSKDDDDIMIINEDKEFHNDDNVMIVNEDKTVHNDDDVMIINEDKKVHDNNEVMIIDEDLIVDEISINDQGQAIQNQTKVFSRIFFLFTSRLPFSTFVMILTNQSYSSWVCSFRSRISK